MADRVAVERPLIPSVVAEQLRRGLEDYLRATFPITTPHFDGLIERLLGEDRQCFKGPYVSVGLPYKAADAGRSPLTSVSLPFRPFVHQQRAFGRLTRPDPTSTIVATGTGSGKTECFLYPILEYCARHRGERGIKAVIVYPMNALAADQAQRIAAAIHGSDALRGYVTAGLYIGEREAQPSDAMTAERIITDRDRLRSHPPDILLTNYKMLDLLLMRPGDQGLWSQNGPRTLRFLVVDELHTFDGAQGTDLACLIRRLKARLKTPAEWIAGIGTSATLGGTDVADELIRFASQVFGEPFDPDAVIGEERTTAAEFLAEHLVEHLAIPREATSAQLDANAFERPEDYLMAQAGLWLPGCDASLNGDGGRVELGKELLKHVAVQNLIKYLGARPIAFEDLIAWAGRLLGEPDAERARLLLTSLLALIAHTRRRPDEASDATTSLVETRLQLWLREWRRMVGSVEAVPRLRFHDDLADDEAGRHLPIVNCRHCGATGWVAVSRAGEPRLTADLQTIYQAYFGEDPDTRMLFPTTDGEPTALARGQVRYLTPHLGYSSRRPEGEPAIRVWVPEPRRNARGSLRLDRNCPYCGATHGISIVGARSASLSSVLVSQWAATAYTSDKRLIAFSDSVQDAAHRAGFITARTWRPQFRAALAQYLHSVPEAPRLSELSTALLDYWRERLGGDAMLIGTFLPADLHWRRDYEQLSATGELPEGSTLPVWLAERFAWECASEFGLRARIGRTLETVGLACASVDPVRTERATERFTMEIRENVPFCDGLTNGEAATFVTGWLHHLRHQGGILIPELEGFIGWGGKSIWFAKGTRALPTLGRNAPVPMFVTHDARGIFDALPPQGPGWHEDWLRKTLAARRPGLDAHAANVFRYLVESLRASGVLVERAYQGQPVWGISPDAVLIGTGVVHLRCSRCRDRIAVAENGDDFAKSACLRRGCPGNYHLEPDGDDYAYFARLYRHGQLHRVNGHDHTGLLKRDIRERLEREFKADERKPWLVNLLSATPTLEMGIDIGKLSAVLLCSVPPARAGYMQRIGRAGRRDGNALALTVAEGASHDLYFYADPTAMLDGPVEPPGLFLDASAVLERQFTAYCIDRWTASGITPAQFPDKLRPILSRIEAGRENGFPYDWFAFVEARLTALLDEFFAMFPELSEHSREHIRRFAAGAGRDEGTLTWRLLDAFQRLAKQRESLRRQIKTLDRRIREGDADPAQGEQWQDKRVELSQEREGYVGIVRQIDGTHALNFLTDEGVIPNYSFPESGVLLRSVIIRGREATEQTGERPYDVSTYDYVRPAAAGLSELAPNAVFYAEKRRVRIDRVDVNVSEIETWRLCPDCNYGERELGEMTHRTCPRCGSAGFQDAGQSREMVRLRQVYATTRERDARFGDDRDDRDSRRFERGLTVDIAPDEIDCAWSIEEPGFPFGFELVRKATLREINYGELGPGPPMQIAGRSRPRIGFALCRHCGTVQSRRPGAAAKHAHVCRAAERDNADDVLDACFLYREFASEAVRILLPATTAATDARIPNSFVAALLYGLRRRFGGRVDHLHATLIEEPVPGLGLSRQYVVLYDSIPGGSGYLPDLLRSPEPFLDLLDDTLRGLTSCVCASDPAKDGCYKCVYAYRLRYQIDQVSRRTAIEMLERVLANREKLEQIETLRSVSISALVESELEARFVEALRRFDNGRCEIRIAPEIVNGKPGYMLTVNGHRYTIEPQVELGPADGVASPTRADFLIHPTRTAPGMLPVAVYTDGLEYHRDQVAQDLERRDAIRRSKRFLAWTLGWKDVDQVLGKSTPGYFEDVLAVDAGRGDAINALYGQFGVGAPPSDWPGNNIELLIEYLSAPDVAVLGARAAVRLVGAADWRDGGQTLDPEWQSLLELDPGRQGRLSSPTRGVDVAVALPAGDAAREWRSARALVQLQADAATEHFEASWLGFWRAFNVLQSLPLAGFSAGGYVSDPPILEAPTPPAAADAWTPAWQDILDVSEPGLATVLRALADAGAPLPEPGYEWMNERGEVCGQAELSWPDAKVMLGADAETVPEGWTNYALGVDSEVLLAALRGTGDDAT